MRGTTFSLALTAALLVAGCASGPDYAYARKSRFERAYRGGAAVVPEECPDAESEDGDCPIDVISVVGALAAILSDKADQADLGALGTPVTAAPR